MLVTNSTGTGLFFRTTSRTSFCSLTGVAWVDQNNTDCALADAVANSDSPNPTSNCAAGRFICFIQFSLCNIGRYRPKSNRFKTSPKTFLENGVSQLAGLKKRGFTLVFEEKNKQGVRGIQAKGRRCTGKCQRGRSHSTDAVSGAAQIQPRPPCPGWSSSRVSESQRFRDRIIEPGQSPG